MSSEHSTASRSSLNPRNDVVNEPELVFARVLCAIDGSRGSEEAVHQAIALCGAGVALCFLAVTHTVGVGLSAAADLSEARAREALAEAARLAREAGIRSSIELRTGSPVSEILLSESASHDLLVIGSHGGSRIGGMMLGSTVTQTAHRTSRALMVARRSSEGEGFPKSILVGSDGSTSSWAAVRLAIRIARVFGSGLRVTYAPDGAHPERYRELLKQISEIERMTGASPVVIDTPGHPADQIIEAARAARSAMVIIGRRGVTGVKALGSVGERVVHRAPCSVLLVPPGSGA
jgi:nucleotide-binding universal stress UspA family protein